MTANSRASLFADWPLNGHPSLPRLRGLASSASGGGIGRGDLGAGLAALASSALALDARRRWREALGRWLCATGEASGSPTPPEDHPPSESIWDDPELWMLIMMH
jgi:hypothetical protein